MKFVLHSHNKIEHRARLHGFNTVCDFQSGTKFVFSLHDTRMKLQSYQNENFIRIENVAFVSCKQMREIFGDGMNSFQNESHSGTM